VAVLLGVIEGQALLRVGAGRGKLTEVKQGGSECRVGLQPESGVVLALARARPCSPNSRAVCSSPREL
jgi:hypothetical protein